MIEKYFFCYDKTLAMWLRYEKGITFITCANHINTGKMFYLFERTPELDEALKEKTIV
jgi:hypothetical protein